MKVYKCDICGTYEPRSIRRFCSSNPEPNKNQPLNKEKYYGFNIIGVYELCDECMHKVERKISNIIFEMQKENNSK